MNQLGFVDIDVINDDLFLHYTSIENLDSISINGLQPKIGKNSKVIEKKKSFLLKVKRVL